MLLPTLAHPSVRPLPSVGTCGLGHRGSFRVLLAVGVRLLPCFCPVRSGGSDSAEQGEAGSCAGRLGREAGKDPSSSPSASPHPGSAPVPLRALEQPFCVVPHL